MFPECALQTLRARTQEQRPGARLLTLQDFVASAELTAATSR